MKDQNTENSTVLQIGLFVTCLVDLLRPQIGMATAKLIESRHIKNQHCEVHVPVQSCCGQPAYNNGDAAKAIALAKQNIEIFESFDYVVVPSGSCAGMIKEHFPILLESEESWLKRAQSLSAKTFELSQFLVDVLETELTYNADHQLSGKTITYHDSCSGLRELGIRSQPRQLLKQAAGINIQEMNNSEICCGFGGTFCTKFPEISTSMVDDKIKGLNETNADVLLGGDLGCLMNIAGRLKRQGSDTKVFHYCEMLDENVSENMSTSGIIGD